MDKSTFGRGLMVCALVGAACKGDPAREETASGTGTDPGATTSEGTTGGATTGTSTDEPTSAAPSTDEPTSAAPTTGEPGTATGMETETETGEPAERCDPGVEAPCYPGAEGSAGLGACQAGTHTCQPDGMSYGACVGAIVPVTEACDTPEDESCDGVAGCTGAPVWNLGFGSGSDLDASDDANRSGLAVDVSGNVWVARSFLTEIEIEGEQLVSEWGNTVLAKFSPSGALLWARKVGSDETQSNLDVTGLAALPEGGVAVIGTYNGPEPEFAGQALPPTEWDGTGVFIAALDANGARKWVVADAGGETFGADQGPRAVVVDGSGNIHVHGDLGGALDFGGGTLTPEVPAGSATFRVSLTAEGAHRWSGAAYGAISAYGATVSDGVLWTSGLFISQSGADFGAGLEAADESYFLSMYLARYDAEGGGYLGATQIPSSGNFYARPLVAAQPGGGVVLTTSFAGDLKLGAEELLASEGPDLLVARFDPLGAPLWHRVVRGGNGGGISYALGGDPLGHTIVAGYTYNGGIDFGTGALPSGPSGALVFKLDPAGGLVWEHRYSDSSSDAAATRLAVGPGGEVALAGVYKDGLELGLGALPGTGEGHRFIALLRP
jgi:hypothetical protein